jgi:hypothetical protein
MQKGLPSVSGGGTCAHEVFDDLQHPLDHIHAETFAG